MLISKAAVFVEANRPLEIREFPVVDPEPGGALVAMDMAAVCGSDVHSSKMVSTPRPLIFGHENIGVLAKATKGIGRDVLGEPLREGDRVIFRAAPCGRCYGCALNENCDNMFGYGQMPISASPMLTGGFSQYVHVPGGRAWFLRIPDDMSTERALLSVIGNHTVYRGIQRAGGISLADTVVVQGSGPIGMGSVVQARIAGAQRVILVGAPMHRLQLGLEMGAHEIVDLAEYPDAKSRVAKILGMTGGKGADVVIEAAGSKSAAQEALQMARPAGKVLLVGSFYDYGEMTVNPTLLVRKALRVVGVAGPSSEGIIRSLQAMNTIVPFPVEKLITHRYSLEQVNTAFHVHETLEAMIPVITPNR